MIIDVDIYVCPFLTHRRFIDFESSHLLDGGVMCRR